LDEFFRHQVIGYKAYASFYKLIEIYNSDKLSETKEIIDNKVTILEYLTQSPVNEKKVKQDLVEEFSKYDKDLRVLTYKVMLEKFNGKYSNLNKGQKEILKEFINSIDNTPRLKEIYNTKISELKSSLKRHITNIEDKVTQIKIVEVVKLLKEIDKSSKINNNDLINLLQYYELTEELSKVK
jgi:RNA processing factor Prp31